MLKQNHAVRDRLRPWALGCLLCFAFVSVQAGAQPAADEAPGVVVSDDGGEYAAAIDVFIDALRAAGQAQDAETMSRLFPMREVLYRNAESVGFSDEMLERLEPLIPQLERQISQQLVNPNIGVVFDEAEVRNVRAHPDGTLVAYVRHRDFDGLVTRMRWWLIEGDDGALFAYDMEVVDVGIRMSTGFLAGFEAAQNNDPEEREALIGMVQLIQFFSAGLFEEAAAQLGRIDGEALSGILRQLYYFIAGTFEAEMGEDYESAVRKLTLALGEDESVPVAYYPLAMAYNGMGEYELALDAAERFTALLDRDADICTQQGFALEMMELPIPAADAYRAGLADDPQSGWNVYGLGCVLEDHALDEFYDAFAALEDNDLWFELLGDSAWYDEDVQALKRLIEALRRADPDAPMLEQGQRWLDELEGE